MAKQSLTFNQEPQEETIPLEGNRKRLDFSPPAATRKAIPIESSPVDEDDPEVKELLPQLLEIDPAAILEPFGIREDIETEVPGHPGVTKTIHNPLKDLSFDTGFTFKEAGDFIIDANPISRLSKKATEFLGLDVPEPTNEELSATLTAWGHGMIDFKRGVKQILEIDLEEEAYNEQIMNDLYADQDLGGYATAGQVGGLITEPVGFLLPGGKMRNVKKAVVVGAGTGALFGFTGYVDESAGESRAVNTITGTILGGGFVYGLNKIGKVVDGRTVQKANRTIRQFETEYAKLISEGNTVPEANSILKETYPGIVQEVRRASEITQTKPHLVTTKEAADEILKYESGLYKAYGGWSFDKVLGILHTRIKNISPEVANALRRFEYNIHRRPHEFVQRANDFTKVYNKLSGETQNKVNLMLANGDFSAARKELARVGGQEAVDAFNKAQKIFDDLGDELVSYGIVKSEDRLTNYWHRGVKDVKGLLRFIGSSKAEAKKITDKIKQRNRSLKADRGYEMTPHEESVFLQGLLTSDRQLQMIGYPSRGIANITEPMLKFYANPIESLDSYIRNALFDIEQVKFFGSKNLKINSKTHMFDPDMTIKKWSENYEALKELDTDQLIELKGMIRARFGAGQQPVSRLLSAFKVFTYSALLGNPIAAGTQFGDIGNSAFKNNLTRSINAMFKTVTGRTDIKVKELGLVESLVQEFADASKGQKTLNFFLKWSGFQSIDRLGKSTLINSALDKFAKGAKLHKEGKISAEFADLESKYRKAWGKDFNKLVKQLQDYAEKPSADKITDDIRFLVWNELSDIQPISLSEVPESYLKSNLGKSFYMLKTFFLKQLDVLRRDIYQEARAGNVAKAIQNATLYSIYMGGANLGAEKIKSLLSNEYEELELEDIPGELTASLFKTFQIDQFLLKEIQQKGPADAIFTAFIVPPVNLLDDVFWKSWGGIKYKDGQYVRGEADPERLIRYVPIVGRQYSELVLEDK